MKIFIHPTCAVSYKLVRHLAERGKLDSVELVDVTDPRVVLREGALSVPFVVYEGVPAATDPLDPREVEEMIEGVYEPSIGDPLEAVRDALIHSSFAAAVALLHDDPTVGLTRELVAAALRTPFTKLDPERVLQEVYARRLELWKEWRDMVARALGVSFVRELWWSLDGRLDPETLKEHVRRGAVRLWLLAKASIGRSGLPWRPSSMPDAVRSVERFVERGAVGLIRKIEREQKEIMNDEEYWRILRERLQ